MAPTVVKVTPLEDYHLLVTFNNGEEKVAFFQLYCILG